MCFFKKKQKRIIEKYNSRVAEAESNAKFKIGEFVHFRYRNELCFGYVDWIYKTENGNIYDIQIGGQCPAVIKGIKEEGIFIIEKKK